VAIRVNVKYVTNTSAQGVISLSSEVADAQTTTVTAAAPNAIPIVQIGKRRKGYKPRTIHLARTTGTAPDLVTHYKKFPVCLNADFAGYISAGTVDVEDSTGTAVTWIIIGYQGEIFNSGL
jgi:hypothetical protein